MSPSHCIFLLAGYEVDEAGFSLAGVKYFNRFKKMALRMVLHAVRCGDANYLGPGISWIQLCAQIFPGFEDYEF